jgi:hypothetical protein
MKKIIKLPLIISIGLFVIALIWASLYDDFIFSVALKKSFLYGSVFFIVLSIVNWLEFKKKAKK